MADKKSKQRLIIVTLILLAALTYLVATSVSSSAYMSTIKEVQEKPDLVGTNVRVAGLVVKGTIEKQGSTYRFKIRDKGKEMTIEYSKGMPSTFGPDIQVIALGKLVSQNELKANEIVTKCPSKYQSKPDKPQGGK